MISAALYKAGSTAHGKERGFLSVTRTQATALFFLIMFVFVVITSTVFTRLPAAAAQFKLIPLWSWHEVLTEGKISLLKQILLNCVLLFPLGFLLPFVCGRKVSAGRAFLSGLIFSLCIELTQLFSHRGLFEFDDMLHNALGCLAGCAAANLLRGFLAAVNKQ